MMADSFTPALRALVAATLLLATATLMLVTVNAARVAGAFAIGANAAYGEVHDFRTVEEARQRALAKCKSDSRRVVAVTLSGCAIFAVDFTDGCGAHGWGKEPRLGRSQYES